MRIDPFLGYIEFMAVAETESFTAAAKKLAISTSHVSRQVSRLEKQLGIRLFARTTRRVSLTEAGIEYYKSCKDVLVGLEEANARARGEHSELTGHIRISAAGDFAETVVAEILVEFLQLHPGLTIDMEFNTRVVNIVDEGFDFAIRYGQLRESNLVARKLIDRRLVAAASQSYVDKFGMPEMPEDLKKHNCIITNANRWVFESVENIHEIKVQGNWRANSARAALAAAKAGQGIIYMPDTSFGSLLRDGDLVSILNDYSHRKMPTWIVYPDRRFLTYRARKAVDFMLNYLA